ncbi:SAV_2336 N-terminal domain-related protein [Streptomyces bobili]|uniref:SAV_2336 N-terminal domain-related protein n=1 Tax=Streptomyces bobili TaxID=67280 RepID=UPI0033C90553
MLPLEHLLRALDGQPIEAEDLADALWLAARLPPPAGPSGGGSGVLDDGDPAHRPPPRPEDFAPGPGGPRPSGQPPDGPPRPQLDLYLPGVGDRADDTGTASPLRLPAPRALPYPHRLVRSLRPLTRRAPSPDRTELDEEATVQHIADTALWLPVLSPAPSRWLDLALVVDDSTSMAVWRETVQEFLSVLVSVGAFRSVQHWTLPTEEVATRGVVLRSPAGPGRDRSPMEIIDPTGRRVVLVVSDCISPAWSDGTLLRLLRTWGRTGPVALVQSLPRGMWERSALDLRAVRLHAPAPGAPNILQTHTPLLGQGDPAHGMAVPVLEMTPLWLGPWASLVSGESPTWDTMVTIVPERPATPAADTARLRQEDPADEELPAQKRLERTKAHLSPAALRLARHLAVVPLSLPVMRLVQQAVCQDSRPSVLTEVLFTGLVTRVPWAGPSDVPRQDRDTVRGVLFDFRPGIRELLLSEIRRTEALQTLTLVADHVLGELSSGQSPVTFTALVAEEDEAVVVARSEQHFATVTAQVLRHLSNRYEALAQRLDRRAPEAGIHGTSAGGGPGPHDATDAMPVPAPLLDRDAVLAELSRAAQPVLGVTGEGTETARIVLVAREGSGTTAVAARYVAEHGASYGHVRWTAAGGTPSFCAPVDLEEAVNRAHAAGRPATWLLVMDGARPQDVPPALPSLPGTLLITSTVDAWPEPFAVHHLPPLKPSASMGLLRGLVPQLSPPVALRVAARLHHLPLALTMAAGLLSDGGATDETGAALLAALGADPTPGAPPAEPLADPLPAVCDLVLERVDLRHPEAAPLLDLLAVLGPGPVPLALLRHVLPGDMETTEAAIGALTRSALVQPSPHDALLSVRPAVRRARRRHMDTYRADAARRLARAALVSCVSALASASGIGLAGGADAGRRRDRAALTCHLASIGALTDRDPSVRAAVGGQVRFLVACGDLAAARSLAEEALAHWGPGDPLGVELAGVVGAEEEPGAADPAGRLRDDTGRGGP